MKPSRWDSFKVNFKREIHSQFIVLNKPASHIHYYSNLQPLPNSGQLPGSKIATRFLSVPELNFQHSEWSGSALAASEFKKINIKIILQGNMFWRQSLHESENAQRVHFPRKTVSMYNAAQHSIKINALTA